MYFWKSTGQESGQTNLTPDPSSIDFKTSVPVAGIIETKHVKLEFTGTTEVDKTGDKLIVNTIFNPDVTETIYQCPPKTWAIGLETVTNFNEIKLGGRIQKDFPIWGNLVAYGRVENDWEWRTKAGIEYRF